MKYYIAYIQANSYLKIKIILKSIRYNHAELKYMQVAILIL